MGNTDKTKEQLIEEMEALRLRTAELERLEAERKQTKEELKGQETKYRAIFESVTDSIVSLDKYGKVLDVNKRAENVFGFTREEVIGRHFTKLGILSLKDLPKTAKFFAEALKGKIVHSIKLEIKRKDGSTALIEVNSALLKKDGKIDGTVAIIHDITERKQAEKALRESEEKFRAIFENTREGIVITDADGRVSSLNPAAATILGYKSTKELVGRSASKISFSPSWKESVLKKALDTGYVENYEVTLKKKDGTPVHILSTANILLDDKGNVIGTEAIFTDITERKKMQEQLIITDRLASIGELASGIAHELNNPLTGVIGFSQLLMEGEIPDAIREDLGIIYSEAQRAALIVKNLLTFAQKHEPVRQLTNVNSIIEGVLKLRDYEQRVNNIQVITQFAPELPEVMVDYSQMQQVFLNIIINAESAMLEVHNQCTLTITTERIEDIVRISFADDGPGISTESLGHIFDPFFTTKEVGKGTGLGLSISYGIVTAHSGQIYAESEPGKGATFIVELPIRQEGE